ncbi:hypothetical protein FSY45_24780 [Comamonas sp. Z1]|uniref:hypothetical protein n=1 Tax=Comamonas TaxID=283 RepID=UPI0011E636A1|nr:MULTISPECIES: hypothetical protein [Comamonas]TYK70282.1 hypothetical protein FSY45_24780 [Comamonas sp. Z1]UBQ44585.1 hypothetical protein LCH15_26210 [Comamonas thiooxydans]
MPAFKNRSAVASGHQSALTPSGPELANARFGQPVDVSDHVVGVIGVIGVLPEGCLPTVAFVRSEALGVGFKCSIGVLDPITGDLSTKPEDGGAAWIVDDTTGAAGGYKQVVPVAFGKVQPKGWPRQIAVKVTGPGNAAGLLGFDLTYFNA